MADTDSSTTPQKVIPQTNAATSPTKHFSHFLQKAVVVTIFLVLLPLFPSEAPEFINQTLHTRGWELLQLVFVGIAVSYGLFSRRNDDAEKDHSSRFDNVQSYVSRFLQVSPVFDEEAETLIGIEENKIQTWNSQYHRGEPVVMVAQEGSVLEDQILENPKIAPKPLLLPVRSLKSRVGEDSDPKLGSKRFSSSNSIRNSEFGGSDFMNLGEKLGENVVLPSPIPWRSRSGRMEIREDSSNPPALFSQIPPSMVESELNRLDSRSFRSSQNSRSSSKPNSSSSSPKKLSPSPSLNSSESQATRNGEDWVRKKRPQPPPRATPPPPPPPPPPRSNSTAFGEREIKRSVRSVPKHLNGNTRETMNRVNSAKFPQIDANSGVKKSVRTIRSMESVQSAMETRGIGGNGKIGRNPNLVSESLFYEQPKAEEEEFVEKVVVESDEESEMSDDDDDDLGEIVSNVGRSGNGEEEEEEEEGGRPDVDKKADEFIAKFREQIRLQRIQSIKRSTGQLSRNSIR